MQAWECIFFYAHGCFKTSMTLEIICSCLSCLRDWMHVALYLCACVCFQAERVTGLSVNQPKPGQGLAPCSLMWMFPVENNASQNGSLNSHSGKWCVQLLHGLQYTELLQLRSIFKMLPPHLPGAHGHWSCSFLGERSPSLKRPVRESPLHCCQGSRLG